MLNMCIMFWRNILIVKFPKLAEEDFRKNFAYPDLMKERDRLESGAEKPIKRQDAG